MGNHSHGWNSITDKPSTFPPSSHSHAWDGITDKPSTFPPSSHGHDYLPLSGGKISGNLELDGSSRNLNLNGSSLYLWGNTSVGLAYIIANGTDMNLIHSGTSGGVGSYINLRANSAVQARNAGNTAWIAMNALAFNTQSSKRYKKNVKNITEKMAMDLLKLRVVTYDYKNKADGINCEGLIAEEVAKVMPYPVYWQDGKVEGLDYSRFMPRVIKLLQMQEQRLRKLEEESTR